MNKRGFTLVELLAVIIILALLALLTSTAITKLVKDSKDELYNTQIELIESAAKAWGADNILKLPGNGQCSYLTIQDLKNYGLLDTNLVDPRNNEEISNDLRIKITTTLNASKDGLITSYEINPEDVSRCNAIYEIYGDVNDDGAVDNTDSEYLNNYVLGTPGYESINQIASDVNLDGKINDKDVIVINNYLAGTYASLPHFVLYGDVNDDNIVNNDDLEYLKNNLAYISGYENINEEASDVNIDGVIDNRDVTTLQRHLTGWEGFETLPVE